MNHTPENWHAVRHPSGNTSIVNSTGKFTVCNCVSRHEDAVRIVACVNACAGIEDLRTTIPALVASLRAMRNLAKAVVTGPEIQADKDVADALLAQFEVPVRSCEDCGSPDHIEGSEKCAVSYPELNGETR
jgi:hypothetical protein